MMLLIPYLDGNAEGSGQYTFSMRKFALINFTIGFSMWILLIFVGYFLRGPDWQLYWPWESWETVKPVEENLWSLSNTAGLTGIIVYLGLGLAIPRLANATLYRKYGFRKYAFIMVVLLLMYAVPLKVFLRLAFNIKYVLVTPWFNV